MRKTMFALSLILLLLTGCGAANYAAEPMVAREEVAGYGGDMAVESSVEMEAPAAPQGDSAWSAEDTTTEATNRMVIKNANLSIVVADPANTLDEIMAMAEEMGGFVVSSNLWQNTLSSGVTVPQASVTVRVPAQHLDEALDQIKSGAGTVRTENVSGEDVTREYTDLQSRLRNLEAAETQLTEIMEEARKTEDVLQVYNNLVEVREQIEVIKGQMQYFEQAAAFSSIQVDIIADEADQPLQIGGWEPVGVVKNAIEALINALQFLVNVAIWMIIFVIPVLIFIGVPIWLFFRLVRWFFRRRKRKKQEKEEEKPPEPADES